jgi:hypothetical protein
MKKIALSLILLLPPFFVCLAQENSFKKGSLALGGSMSYSRNSGTKEYYNVKSKQPTSYRFL